MATFVLVHGAPRGACSVGAAEFASWYSGRPRARPQRLDKVLSAAVIGAGNVALDIVRFLVRDPRDFAKADLPDSVLTELARKDIDEVHLIARGGADQSRFTPAELAELGELDDVDLVVDPRALAVETQELLGCGHVSGVLVEHPGSARSTVPVAAAVKPESLSAMLAVCSGELTASPRH